MLHHELTDRIIGCAIEVHRSLGPGLTEYSYQSALGLEMQAQSIPFVAEPSFKVRFRDVVVGWHRPDFVVDDLVVVELKAVAHLESVFTKQVLTYLKVTGLRVGLLMNFNVASMNLGGIKRFIL